MHTEVGLMYLIKFYRDSGGGFANVHYNYTYCLTIENLYITLKIETL